MKYTSRKLPESRLKITVELTPEESKNTNTGKAQQTVLLKRFQEIQEKESFAILTPPEFGILKKNPLKFEILFTVPPSVKLPPIEELKVPTPKEEPITEEDIKYVLGELQRSRANITEKEGKAEKGDRVIVDYEGRDSEDVVQMAAKDAVFNLGSGDVIPDLEKEVMGMSAGDEKEFSVTFAKDYFQKLLAGETLNFKIKVHVVEALDLPELSDKFAAEVLEKGKTIDDLRRITTEGLKERKKARSLQEQEDAVLNQIVEKAQIEDFPTMLVEQEIDHLINEMYKGLKQKGIDREHFEEHLRKEGKDPRKQLKKQAKRNVIFQLALREIFKDKKWAITDGEIETEMSKWLMQAPPDQQDEWREKLKNSEEAKEQIRQEMRLAKLLEYLKS